MQYSNDICFALLDSMLQITIAAELFRRGAALAKIVIKQFSHDRPA
jgi:hypothetical protein